MQLTIVTTQAERDEKRRTLNAWADYIGGEMSREEFLRNYPRKVWLDMSPRSSGDELQFVVVDNREGECFCEDFATLDGAMLYATDVKTTSEYQAEWDYMGSLKDGGDIVDRLREGK